MENKKLPEWVSFRVKRPEGYENVADILVLEDLLANPNSSWEIEVVDDHSPGATIDSEVRTTLKPELG